MSDDAMTPTNTSAAIQSEHTAMASASGQDTDTGGTFPLLDLPPEIWSRICKLAVRHDREILLEKNEDEWHYQNRVQQPPITRVCATIRNETISSFYSLNTFAIWDDSAGMYGLVAWIRGIGSARTCHLKQLYVDSPYRDELKEHIEHICEADKLGLSIQGSKDSEFKSLVRVGHRMEELRRYRLSYVS